jgi:spore coat protein H
MQLRLTAIGIVLLTGATGLSASVTNTIVDFQPNLPLVFLDAKEQIVSDQKVSCRLRIMAAKNGRETSNAWTGVVRFHGATSQAYAKKSFALTLDKPAALVGLRESPHWVLNAAFVDRSLMRHKLSYDLFRSLSDAQDKRFAASSRFVEVFLNGKYHGAYLLMERVDRELLELQSYKSNKTSHACIYKAVDHAANFGRPDHAGYEQREPPLTTGEYWKPLDEFNSFVSSAPDAQFFDERTGISSRLNIDNAIDFHLLVLFTSNMDGITKNFIFARDALTATNTEARFFFAPWDYDATFGRNWDATRVAPTAWLSNHLFERLLSAKAFRERFAARWKRLREGPFSVKAVQQMIDDNVRTLGEAVQRNAQRWRGQAGAYPDRLTFEQDVQEMKAWIVERSQWLDQQIDRMAAR